MSTANYKLIRKLTNGKSINHKVVSYAQELLFSLILDYATNQEQLEQIKEKLSSMEVKLLTDNTFKRTYNKYSRGVIPYAFAIDSTIYLKISSKLKNYDFHNLIHEMLHVMSANNKKMGLYQRLENHQFYGYGFNEAFTEYMTSLLLDEKFINYPSDLNYMIQLFMELSNTNTKEMFKLYTSGEEWISSDIVKRFNASNDSLIDLIIEYDNRLATTRVRSFNPDKVLRIILDSVQDKIDNDIYFDKSNVSSLLRQYYNFFEEWDLDPKIRERVLEVIDNLKSSILVLK